MGEVKLIGIDVSENIEILRDSGEQRLALISCSVDANLLEGVENYQAFTESNGYEALMDALDKYVDDPSKDVWYGETINDPEILAILERDYDTKVGEDELAFTATIQGDLSKYEE